MPKKEKPKLTILVQGKEYLVRFRNTTEHHEFCEAVHNRLGDEFTLELIGDKVLRVIYVRASDVVALIS